MYINKIEPRYKTKLCPHMNPDKYISAETKKCDLGEATVMNGQLTCAGMDNKTVVAAALKAEVFTDKNPYDGTKAHVLKPPMAVLTGGVIYLHAWKNDVHIYSCHTKEVCMFTSQSVTQSIVTIE